MIEHTVTGAADMEGRKGQLAKLLEAGERDGGFETWDYDKFRAAMHTVASIRHAAKASLKP